MESLVTIRLAKRRARFAPGDVLDCDYQIDRVDPREIVAIEASVLWHTEGKGDEDLGVHYFERRTPTDSDEDWHSPQSLSVRLPNSPLSYDGIILKIVWGVRVRLFLRRGRELTSEQPFELLPRQWRENRAISQSSAAGDEEAARRPRAFGNGPD